MKKYSNLTYSSQSSSSSSNTNFDPTMCNSKNANAGCLSAILRKILCSGGLPTHPSDQIRDLDSNSIVGNRKDQNFKIKHHANRSTTTSSSTSTSTGTTATTSSSSTSTSTSTSTTAPNIVARLMGLDSMVEVPSISLSRSKSMNSVDCLGECNRIDGLHKRVSSTLSFREVPTFLLLENENFFVLSFDNGNERNGSKFKSSGRKKEMGCAELKQRERRERVELNNKEKNKREKGYSDENVLVDNKGKMSKKVCDLSCGSVGNGGKLKDITNTCSNQNKITSEERKKKKCFDSGARRLLAQHKNIKEEVLVGEKMKRRRRKKKRNCCNEKKLETECKSEQDSSPVSVLDFQREPCGTDGLSSRRKLSTELENDKKTLPRSDGNLMVEESKINAIENNKCEGSEKRVKHSQEYRDIWGQVCKIAEEDLAETIQINAWKNKQDDHLGSISEEFESEILDHLLNELVDQLVEDPVILNLEL